MSRRSLLHHIDTARVLQKALSRGGSFAEIFAEEKSACLIEIEDRRVEKLVIGAKKGAGVRVLHGTSSAYSYTDFLEEKELLECARVASQAVKQGNKKKTVPAGPRRWRHHRFSALVPASKTPVEERLKILWKAENAARKTDKRVRQVRILYQDSCRTIAVANSEGLMVTDTVPYLVFHVLVVAADDSVIQAAHESAGGTCGLELFDEQPPEELAVKAATRAVRNLSARPAPAGAMPVVMAAEAGGTMIHEAIGHGLEADLAEEGLSVYKGRVGEQVASPLITVIDDPTLPGKRGSFNIDDEGTPAQPTVLVERGVLKGYLYDRRTALKTGNKSTGNGRRQSYEYPPIVRMTNTMIAAGESDPEEVIRAAEQGLLVRRMGGGEVNTVNGDFVFEVEDGWLIEKGTPVEPVRGATIAGNGPEILKKVEMVGRDLGFGIGTCGKDGQGVPVADAQPTLLIPEMVVGGRIQD